MPAVCDLVGCGAHAYSVVYGRRRWWLLGARKVWRHCYRHAVAGAFVGRGRHRKGWNR